MVMMMIVVISYDDDKIIGGNIYLLNLILTYLQKPGSFTSSWHVLGDM
jgi:hypothetical protein